MQLKANPTKGEGFADIMKRASMSDLEGNALGKYGSAYEAPKATANADTNKKEDAAPHSMHAFGAHFCEVHVDPELGTNVVDLMSALRASLGGKAKPVVKAPGKPKTRAAAKPAAKPRARKTA